VLERALLADNERLFVQQEKEKNWKKKKKIIQSQFFSEAAFPPHFRQMGK